MRWNFSGAVPITSGFSDGVTQIWLDDVQCRGTETRLIDCPARPLGSHNCGHTEDAGVQCGMLDSSIVCWFPFPWYYIYNAVTCVSKIVQSFIPT